MISEVEAAMPLYLVFVSSRNSWNVRPESEEEIFDWLELYIAKHYEVEGIVDIVSKYETLYIWGEDSKIYTPLSKTWLAIYRRKEPL